MENAKKNLVFHFGVGRQAAFYRIDYVKGRPCKMCESVQQKLGHTNPVVCSDVPRNPLNSANATFFFDFLIKEE